jgi:hypothetical protein
LRGTVQMLQSLEPPPGIAIPVPRVPPLHGIIYRQDRTKVADAFATTSIRMEPKRYGPTPSAYETFLALARELLPHLSDTLPVWDTASVHFS